jgi:predicted ArsR family transcriptional regulator
MGDAFYLFGEQPAPARYPRAPGFKARETSKAAAEAITAMVGTLRERVLAEIKRKPSTPDEVAARLGITVLAARPRVTELSKLGLITDAGERRKNDSGRTAIVWKAVS